MSTPDRLDLFHEEWLQDYFNRSNAYLKTACGIDVPPEPEVQAILEAWENGSDEKPWQDAERGSEKGAGPWAATPAGEDPAPTGWQERGSSSEQSAA